MATIKCPECKGVVSQSARSCPHCGFEINKPKRGFFGIIFKWFFILFNVLMLFAFIQGSIAVSDMPTHEHEAAKAGAAIGSAIGMGMIVTVWALGDVILGLFVLFTRPR